MTDDQLITVRGMTCADCAARVERALGAVAGVTGVRVALASERASVSGTARLETLLAAIRALGYEAEPYRPMRLRARIEERRERRRREERYWRGKCAAALLALPVLFLALAPPRGMDPHHLLQAQFVLATLALSLLAPPFYRRGLPDLAHARFGMDSLVTLGTLVAYVASVAALAGGRGHVHFEDAVAILAALTVGRWLEARGRARAAASVEGLIDLEAPLTRVARGGGEREVPTETVLPGDEVLIRPGDKVTVDGVVIEGRAEADESLLTGESLPVAKAPGDRVIAGSHVTGGALRVRAERTGEETALIGILREMERVSESRTRDQDLADRVIAVFMPLVLGVAVLSAAGWYLATGSLTGALRPAVAVLIIACPCALGIAIPVAVAVGAGMAARRGILIRDAAVLDAVPRLAAVVLDKTGTVTAGAMRLVAMRSTDVTEGKALEIVARLESLSEHPVARALDAAWRARAGSAADNAALYASPALRDFRASPGHGVEGRVDEWQARVGDPAWCAAGLDAEDEAWVAREEAAGRSVFAASLARASGPARALFALADAPRPEAAAVVAGLRARGLRTVLLSGAREPTVRAVARDLGFDGYLAGVTPAAKAGAVARLREELGGPVAMVGDGVNDAPALAAADLGVALASGAGLAVEAGAVILTRPDLRLIEDLLELGRAIRTKTRQNLFWAFAYNILLIPAAALGWASPLAAALAMALSDVTVIGNALLLRRARPGQAA